jgi:protein-tyrosine-phosphatase
VHLVRSSLPDLDQGRRVEPGRALFVCTRNAARSQLAAALWRSLSDAPAESAGTHPADRVHPGAIGAARRARLTMDGTRPRSLHELDDWPPLVITVCDQAHEEIEPPDHWLHWSIPDPVPAGSAKAFDAAVDELRERIGGLLDATPAAQ